MRSRPAARVPVGQRRIPRGVRSRLRLEEVRAERTRPMRRKIDMDLSVLRWSGHHFPDFPWKQRTDRLGSRRMSALSLRPFRFLSTLARRCLRRQYRYRHHCRNTASAITATTAANAVTTTDRAGPAPRDHSPGAFG